MLLQRLRLLLKTKLNCWAKLLIDACDGIGALLPLSEAMILTRRILSQLYSKAMDKHLWRWHLVTHYWFVTNGSACLLLQRFQTFFVFFVHDPAHAGIHFVSIWWLSAGIWNKSAINSKQILFIFLKLLLLIFHNGRARSIRSFERNRTHIKHNPIIISRVFAFEQAAHYEARSADFAAVQRHLHHSLPHSLRASHRLSSRASTILWFCLAAAVLSWHVLLSRRHDREGAKDNFGQWQFGNHVRRNQHLFESSLRAACLFIRRNVELQREPMERDGLAAA